MTDEQLLFKLHSAHSLRVRIFQGIIVLAKFYAYSADWSRIVCSCSYGISVVWTLSQKNSESTGHGFEPRYGLYFPSCDTVGETKGVRNRRYRFRMPDWTFFYILYRKLCQKSPFVREKLMDQPIAGSNPSVSYDFFIPNLYQNRIVFKTSKSAASHEYFEP